MLPSLNYTFKKHGNRVPLYIFSVILLTVYVIMNVQLPHYSMFLVSSCSVLPGAIVMLVFAIKKTKIVKLVKRIQNGLGVKSYGEVDGGYWSGEKTIRFVYELEDGRIGKTEQVIDRDIIKELKKKKIKVVPILVYETYAILDEDKVKNNDLNCEKTPEILSKISEIEDTTTYGRLIEGIIYFAIGVLLIFASIIVLIFYATSAISITILMPVLFATLFNPITPLFIVLGACSIRNYYFIPHIKDLDRIERENCVKEKREYKQEYGTFVPLKNIKVKNEKSCFRDRIKFTYDGNDG